MAENDTQKMLKALLVMQAEMLGRIERIETAINTNRNPDIDPRFEALAELESLMDGDLGASLRSDIEDLIAAVNHGR